MSVFTPLLRQDEHAEEDVHVLQGDTQSLQVKASLYVVEGQLA